MDARVEKLLSAFEKNGWKISGSADISVDWWFEDIIQLSSIWHPIGTNLYITLLTDPMITDRKKVWAVKISSEVPNNKHYKFLEEITLNDIKRIDLDLLVKTINKLVLRERKSNE